MGHDAVMGEKAALRKAIRAQRAEQGSPNIDPSMMSLLPAHAVVAGYLARGDEPSIDALLGQIIARGSTVILPRVDGGLLHWVAVTDLVQVQVGAYGIREPIAGVDADVATVNVVLLPALAVDHRGIRLGQGGGYYDRALAGIPRWVDGGPCRIAVINDAEFIDEVPAEPHDVIVDAVMTPSTLHWLTQRATQ